MEIRWWKCSKCGCETPGGTERATACSCCCAGEPEPVVALRAEPASVAMRCGECGRGWRSPETSVWCRYCQAHTGSVDSAGGGMETAAGADLDRVGEQLFGEARRPEEPDDAYRDRLVRGIVGELPDEQTRRTNEALAEYVKLCDMLAPHRRGGEWPSEALRRLLADGAPHVPTDARLVRYDAASDCLVDERGQEWERKSGPDSMSVDAETSAALAAIDRGKDESLAAALKRLVAERAKAAREVDAAVGAILDIKRKHGGRPDENIEQMVDRIVATGKAVAADCARLREEVRGLRSQDRGARVCVQDMEEP